MVKFVGEDPVFLAHQRRDRPEVGGEAGLEGDGRFNALEGCDPLFKLEMQVHGPGDGADSSGPMPYWFIASLAACTRRG